MRDYDRIARQLLRAIRGARSQVAFARRLGYRGNPIANWEAGRRFPTAAEVFRACERVRIDVPGAIEVFHPRAAAAFEISDEGVAAWLRVQQGSASSAELARRIGTTRHRVARWLTGQTRPRLPDFLALLDGLTGRSTDLIALLVAIDDVPDAVDDYRTRAAIRRVAIEAPWSAAVLRILETEAYARESSPTPAWIAGALGVTTEEATDWLARMVAAGVLTLAEGRWVPAAPLTVDTAAYPEARTRFRDHWLDVAKTRVANPHERDSFSYNLASMSREDLEAIRDLYRQTYRQMRQIVAASEPVEVAVLIQAQIVTWDPESPPEATPPE